MAIRILIVEDDPHIGQMLQASLSIVQYESDLCDNGTDALPRLLSGEYDLALLDVMLPGQDGFSLMEQARGGSTPVIFLTARQDVADRVKGLRLGAEDYIVKPFETVELLARIEVVLRRAHRTQAVLTYGDIVLNIEEHTVKKAGEPVALTPKEFDLLVFLASNKGIALSREKILQKVWNYDYFGEDRTVDTHVKMLRGHLGKCRSYIATVWGIGYKFDPDAAR